MANMPEEAPRKKQAKPKRVSGKHKETTTQRGYGARWQHIRLLILASKPFCEVCNSAFAQQVHHIDHSTANTNRANLMSVCVACHQKIEKDYHRGNNDNNT